MTKAITNKLNKIEDLQKKMFWASLLITVFFATAYGLLVRDTIMNVVGRQNMEKEISALASSVGSLESDYISLKNNVTLELAYSKGFVANNSQKFVMKGDAGTQGLSVLSNY